MATVLTLAAVATDEPEVAENMVAVAMLACTKPPGNHETHRSKALYVVRAMPERTRISPSKIKKGMAINDDEFDVDQTMRPSAFIKGNALKKLLTPNPSKKSTIPTGIVKANIPSKPTTK
jgi:predicted type IV restriction endonuclease